MEKNIEKNIYMYMCVCVCVSLEKELAAHSSILAWESPWNLVGCSPRGLQELDMTEWPSMHAYICITESLCYTAEMNTTL